MLGIASGADKISAAVINMGRLISLLTFVLIREKPCSMEDISADDAGMGLVIDGPRFAKAVRARLRGLAPVEKVPTFKGTALRMARAMA
eukprot:scaffold200339_cov53-Prasinocladus_malaysianus.AAC.1